MPSIKEITELVHSYNMYGEGAESIGVTSSVKYPDLDVMTVTVSGSGVLGEYEAPAVGHFPSMQAEIAFRGAKEAVGTLNEGDAVNYTLRASVQVRDTDGKIDQKPLRTVFKGTVNKVSSIEVKQANAIDVTASIEVQYMKIEYDGNELLEIDKLNYVYKVNGKDALEKVRANI